MKIESTIDSLEMYNTLVVVLTCVNELTDFINFVIKQLKCLTLSTNMN